MIEQGKKPLKIIAAPCGQVTGPLKLALAEEGLFALQSFDLQSTRALHEGCTCPHHGTEQCTCELVVLLVYAGGDEPLSLVLDGRDSQTFVFVSGENAANGTTLGFIRAALAKTGQSFALDVASGLPAVSGNCCD